MSARRIKAIVLKDLLGAMRDGRILVLLLMPIGLAVFYNAAIPDDERPETTVAIADPAKTGIASELRRITDRSVKLDLVEARDERAVRRILEAKDAEVGIVARPRSRADAPPRADVLLAADPSPSAESVAALVDDAVAGAADRPPASVVRVQRLTVAAADRSPADVVDQSTILVVVCIVMLLGFVALIVVPMQVADEIETGTFGALRLAATGREILAAKTLSGMLYALVGTALTILITGVDAHDPLRLYGGALGLAISLVGFGLLLGFLSGNTTQINTYGGFLVFPVILVASAVLLVDSGIAKVVLDLLPFSQGARLLFDGVSPVEPFATGALAWLVLAAWSLAGFAVLVRVASRRDA